MTRKDFFKAFDHCIEKLEEAEITFNFAPHEYKLTDDIFEESCIAVDENNFIYVRNNRTIYSLDDVLKITYSCYEDEEEGYIKISLCDESILCLDLCNNCAEIYLSYLGHTYFAYKGKECTDLLMLMNSLQKNETDDDMTIVDLGDEVRLVKAINKQQTHITIPDGVTSINSEAFKEFTSLEQIDFPNSIKEIEKYAFYGCSSIQKIRISSHKISISDNAFSECSSINFVEITADKVYIHDKVFWGCSALSDIKIEGKYIGLFKRSLTKIGEHGLKHLVVTEGTDLNEVLGLDNTLIDYISVPSCEDEDPV